MTRPRYDFTINQGKNFSLIITLNDPDGAAVDLTNYEARLQCREYRGSTVKLLDWVYGSEITIPIPTNGTILISLTNVETAAMKFNSGEYDLEIYDPAVNPLDPDVSVEAGLYGITTINKEVTR